LLERRKTCQIKIADKKDMDALDNVRIGMTAEKTVVVASEMTVGHFVANMPQVYATPMMILHMEMASGAAIAAHLPDDSSASAWT